MEARNHREVHRVPERNEGSGRSALADNPRDSVVGPALGERVRTWVIGSDPGLVRLHSAIRTTVALGLSLLVLFVVASAAGQPVTVAVLGAVVAMVSARAVNEPDARSRRITLALLPLPATVALVAATLLDPYKVVADAVFVAITFAAVYARRFGSRGMALGMVTVMSYFFTLFLEAKVSELPWLIVAVVVGSLCSLVLTSYLLPERPERVLRRTVSSLRARMAIVVDAAAETVQAGRFDERHRRRLRVRMNRLTDTVLSAQGQLEEKVDPATVWPGVTSAELTLRLFDAELTVERIAITAARAAEADLPAATRAQLVGLLRRLATELHVPGSVGMAELAEQARGLDGGPDAHRLATAVVDTTAVIGRLRALAEQGGGTADAAATSPPAAKPSDEEPASGLRPTTRQAVQVAIATTLAIIAGEALSPARWYWAVIAAFVTFAGTTSFGETLTKGWQRLLGTLLGVPSGVLVATVVSGNTAAAVVMIFLCLFFAFYLMAVSYSLMIFWVTTMLALMYGLLGQFSVDVLLLRLGETAVGTAIGVGVAVLVLPARTGTAIRAAARDFLAELSTSVSTSAEALGGGPTTAPSEQARIVHRSLQDFRTTAKPLTVGIAGIAGRTSIRRGLRLLKACDHYARALARASEGPDPGSVPLAEAITAAAEAARANIDALAEVLDRHGGDPEVRSAADLIDAADAVAGQLPDDRRLQAGLHALHQIDRAVVDAAADLGAQNIRLW